MYRRICFIWLFLDLFLTNCTHNTTGIESNGRVYLIVDLNPDAVGGGLASSGVRIQGLLYITLNVEGFDPVKMEKVAIENGPPLDLWGREIEGGSEVTIEVCNERCLKNVRMTFKVDGNVTLKVRFADPRIGGDSIFVLERLT